MSLSFDQLSLDLRGKRVLDAVSGILELGAVTALLGANGAGKTSLLSCLAGLRQPDSGTVTLSGSEIIKLDRRERARQIGLLPQRPDISWDVDARTIVELGRLPHMGRWGLGSEDNEAVARAMAATDCTELADRPILQLSGGEQSRVLLARALAGEPQWLLADEPLASLDPAYQFELMERLREIARNGRGVVIVLHDITMASRFADRVILMKNGRVLIAGCPSEVLTDDNMSSAYGVNVETLTSGNGDRLVLPLPASPA